MRVILKDDVLVIVPDNEDDRTAAEAWAAGHAEHVFRLRGTGGGTLELHDLGERSIACREPINVVSTSRDPQIRLIGNFATAPFELDGQRYVSVESFWQGLKFNSEKDRRRLAGLDGRHARAEGEKQGYGDTITYRGDVIPVGTWRHWQLMEQACRAKFDQHLEARAALRSTGERPLLHMVRRDSKTIPGVIMAEIWMRVRAGLARHTGT